jgi:tetratricopeptide (TPR) repeat protein
MVESEGHKQYLTANLLFLKDEEPEEILFHAKSAIELGLSTSEEAEMRRLVGSIYFTQENFSEAEAETKKALELDEKSDEKLNALLYSTSCQELARIYENRGDIPQAIKCLEDAVIHLQTQYDPDKEKAAIGMVFNGLAAMYMAQYLSNPNELSSADEQCFQSLQRSLEINPYYYETYLYLGILHGSKEIAKYYDPQKAIDYYEQALTRMGPLDSDDSEERAKREMAQENIELIKKEVKSTGQGKGEPKKKGFFKKLFD